MHCPKCTSETNVTDSRYTAHGVRRRRKCTKCDYKVTTLELPIPPNLREPHDQVALIIKKHFASELREALEAVIQNSIYRAHEAESETGDGEGSL